MNPYQVYKQASVAVTPGKLLLMLYDGLLRFTNEAKSCIETEDIEGAHKYLLKSQDIVLELRSTLDHEKAPQLCENLSSVYTFVYTNLVDANRLKSTAPLEEILPLIEEIRAAFEQAERQLSSEESE